MTSINTSPDKPTGWRKKLYRETLTIKEENMLWELIDDFIISDPNQPRSQLRFFKAIEQLTKTVHFERIRWKEMKLKNVSPIMEEVFNLAFEKYNITYSEILKRHYNVSIPVQKARKYVVSELLNRKMKITNIARALSTSHDRLRKWKEYDCNI
jgi:hypothetical protein